MTEEQEVRAIALDAAVKALPALNGGKKNKAFEVLDLASLFEIYIKEGWVKICE